MSLFSFGGVICDLLISVFEAWNSLVDIVFGLLIASPEEFKDGGPWQIIEEINPIFVAVGSSLVVIFFVIGFCSESIDVKDDMRLEKILTMLCRLGLAEFMVANSVTIMKAIFQSVGNLVGLLSLGNGVHLRMTREAAEALGDLGFCESYPDVDLGKRTVTGYPCLRIFHALYGVFPLLKDPDRRAARVDRLLNHEWKPHGDKHGSDLYEVLPIDRI